MMTNLDIVLAAMTLLVAIGFGSMIGMVVKRTIREKKESGKKPTSWRKQAGGYAGSSQIATAAKRFGELDL